MKKLLPILLVFFITNSFAQQDWAPIGAKWWYKIYCFETPDCGYETFTSVKDTVVNGSTAKIIERKVYGGEPWTDISDTSLIMFYQDEKVFNYDYLNQEFYVLYDFNLNVGDTLTIQDSTKYRGFYNYDNDDLNEIALFQIKIDSIDYHDIDNQSLKHLYTSPTDDSKYFFNGPIIERIGNKINMFGQATTMIPGGYPEYLRCYKDDLIDLTDSNCEYISTVDIQDVKPHAFKVYPTLTKDFIYIEGNNNLLDEILEISITNLEGKNIVVNEFISVVQSQSNKIRVNLNNLDNGLYILRILTLNDTFSTKIIRM